MDNDQRVQLRVMGISFSTLQSGAYALIMAQVDGPYRIPIVIGEAEAKSIALAVEGLEPPRPLTHDLLLKVAQECGAQLREVLIYRFENGIFYSQLTFAREDGEFTVDSRTSDAVAIALRTQAPIWTTPAVISEAGFIINATTSRLQREQSAQDSTSDSTDDDRSDDKPDNSIEQLQQLLQKMVDDENYEEAARIAKIIEQRNKQNKP